MDTELTAIRQVVADAERFQNDLDGFTGLLTSDVAIVNIAGRRVLGWDAVHQAYRTALSSPLANVLTTHEIQDIRFLRPDVALVSCLKRVSDEREPAATEGSSVPEQGSLTFVLVKQFGRWLIASAQTTPIRT